jgi:hypothetical protein
VFFRLVHCTAFNFAKLDLFFSPFPVTCPFTSHFCCGWNSARLALSTCEAAAAAPEFLFCLGRSALPMLLAASARAAAAASALARCCSSASAAAAAAASAASGSLKMTPNPGPLSVCEPLLSLAGEGSAAKGSSVAREKRSPVSSVFFSAAAPGPPPPPPPPEAPFFFCCFFFCSAAKSLARTERGACDAAKEDVCSCEVEDEWGRLRELVEGAR